MLAQYQAALEAKYAPMLDLDRWWPGRTRFEIVASAILVQNTAWSNVERALGAMRRAGKLSPAGVRGLSEAELGGLIRSSGCWRQKARTLKGFVAWLDGAHGGSLGRLFAQPTERAREQLLGQRGIGEETADAMLLYAGGHAVLVWDAYTRRILARHGHEGGRAGAEREMPREAGAARRLHAVLVETAKRYCHKRAPDCGGCPLAEWLPGA